jgi:hypothetical protein
MEAQMEFQTKQMEQAFKMKETEMDLGVEAVGHQQQMQHDSEMFSFKQYEAEQKAKQAAEPKVREPRPPKKK